MYHYPNLLRRLGAVPGLVRLVALAVEMITFVLLAFRHRLDNEYTTSYLILAYLTLIDAVEITCLYGQPRGWPLPALPMLIAGDLIGLLMLLCSRDWYGLWYWHGPWYSLSKEIGMGLFIALPVLRGVLFVLSGLEYWYENTEDRLLSEERRRLLPY